MIFTIRFKRLLTYLSILLVIICVSIFAIIKTNSHDNALENSEESDSKSSNTSLEIDSHIGESKKIPIIMYHGLLKDKSRSNKHTITPEEFEDDLKYLKENGYTTVIMEDLIKYVYEGKQLPDKPIVLTFDDGYYNNYYYGFELLQKYDMKAVLSVVGIYSQQSEDRSEENPNYSYITWDKIKEISSSGIFEIQNHTYNLHNASGSKGIKKKFR